MNADELLVLANRVLDRCPRHPMELPADDPMRLLYELTQGNGLAELESRAAEAATDEAEDDSARAIDDAEAETRIANERADEFEEKLGELRTGIDEARTNAVTARTEGRSSAGLNALIDALAGLLSDEAKAA